MRKAGGGNSSSGDRAMVGGDEGRYWRNGIRTYTMGGNESWVERYKLIQRRWYDGTMMDFDLFAGYGLNKNESRIMFLPYLPLKIGF